MSTFSENPHVGHRNSYGNRRPWRACSELTRVGIAPAGQYTARPVPLDLFFGRAVNSIVLRAPSRVQSAADSIARDRVRETHPVRIRGRVSIWRELGAAVVDVSPPGCTTSSRERVGYVSGLTALRFVAALEHEGVAVKVSLCSGPLAASAPNRVASHMLTAAPATYELEGLDSWGMSGPEKVTARSGHTATVNALDLDCQ